MTTSICVYIQPSRGGAVHAVHAVQAVHYSRLKRSSTMETEGGNKRRQQLELKFDRRLAERMTRAENNKKDKGIALLKEEKLALEEKVKATLGTVTELKKQVKDVTERKQDEVFHWKRRCTLQDKERCQLVKEKETLKAKHQTELQKQSNSCNKEMSEQTVTHQSDVSKAAADKKSLQDRVLALEDQHLVDKDIHAQVEASLHAAEEDTRRVTKRLQEETLQKEELERIIVRKDNLAQVNHTKYCDLKDEHDKRKARTGELIAMDALKENNASLEKTVTELKKVVQNQNKEASVLKNTINDYETSLERKEKEIAILNLELRNELRKGLGEKLKDSEIKSKMETEALKKVYKENALLTKKVSGHTSLVEGYNLEKRKDKERVRSLENYQQQSKKDLHGCFQLISDPVSFKKSLIAYYRCYLDGDATVLVHKEDITTAVGIKKAAHAYYTAVRTEQFNQRDENKKMLKKKQEEDHSVSQYIDTINTQRRLIKTLEECAKPSKPVTQKGTSRFETNAPRSPRVPEGLEARQYDDCLKISGLPEEEDRLPEPSSSDPSSSTRPQEGIHVQVKPYVPQDVQTDVIQP